MYSNKRTYGSLPAWIAPSACAALIRCPLVGRLFCTSRLDGNDVVDGPLTEPDRRGVRSDMFQMYGRGLDELLEVDPRGLSGKNGEDQRNEKPGLHSDTSFSLVRAVPRRHLIRLPRACLKNALTVLRQLVSSKALRLMKFANFA